MNRILFYALFFHLCSCPSLRASHEDVVRHANALFSHIENPDTRRYYLYTLNQIRKGRQVPDSFFEKNPDLSDFYFNAKQKKYFEIDTDGVGRLKAGDPITIPVWVEAAYRKNWEALKQLLCYSPAIVTEAYNDNPFCKIVFSAGPPQHIIEQIVEITKTLSPEVSPFLEGEKNPALLPLSSLHLETPDSVVALCMNVSLEAAKTPSYKRLFYNNSARLCARHIVANTNSFLLTMPISEKCDHTRIILLHLIDEEKYHGFRNYFAFLTTHAFSSDDCAYLISSGLNHFATKGNKDISQETKAFFSAALSSFPNQEIDALSDLVNFLRDEYRSDKKIDPTTVSARTVSKIIENHSNSFERRKRQKTA